MRGEGACRRLCSLQTVAAQSALPSLAAQESQLKPAAQEIQTHQHTRNNERRLQSKMGRRPGSCWGGSALAPAAARRAQSSPTNRRSQDPSEPVTPRAARDVLNERYTSTQTRFPSDERNITRAIANPRASSLPKYRVPV